jgi:hypothetical protein
MIMNRLLKSSDALHDFSYQAFQGFGDGRLSDRFSQTDDFLPSLQICRSSASQSSQSRSQQSRSTAFHRATQRSRNSATGVRNGRSRQTANGANLGTNSTTAEWTVLVYMAGHNLETYGIQDFLEMAAVGSSANVKVVVQFDRTARYASSYGNWTDTRRGLVQAGSTPGLNWGTSIGEANMGDANTLKNFVNWGTSTYKAKHYALVMWGHGDGFKVSVDDVTGDAITGNELNSVLAGQTHRIELVGADACLMSTTEFAYQISESASVFVASQELEPGTGWNYTPILQDLTATPTLTAAQLGTAIVNRYAQTYPALSLTRNETLSAINLAALRSSNPFGLTQALNTFANTVMTSSTSDDLDFLNTIRGLYANDFGDGGTDLCDIGKLFTQVINTEAITATVRSTAQIVLNAYSTTVVHNYTAIPGRSSGLSLYFSGRGARPTRSYSQNDSFLVNMQWDDFLNWLWW